MLGRWVCVNVAVEVDTGTCEVSDSPFRRASPWAVKWHEQRLPWGRTPSSMSCWPPGTTRARAVGCTLCDQLLLGSVLYCTLGLHPVILDLKESFSILVHIACHCQCCVWLKMGPTVVWPGKNYFSIILILYYLFCWLFVWIKKKS